jgi:hypothetical protein
MEEVTVLPIVSGIRTKHPNIIVASKPLTKQVMIDIKISFISTSNLYLG